MVHSAPVIPLPRPASVPSPERDDRRLRADVEALAQALAADAVERDRDGGHAAGARERIRASGLLGLTVERALGGLGATWPVFFHAVRRLAAADSAMAHVFAFHHLQLATLSMWGTPGMVGDHHRETVERGLWWGNALNTQDPRAVATAVPGGWRVSGRKGFCSGSVGADRLIIGALHVPTQTPLVAWLPADAAGLHIEQDWDGFGQRQTDSGSVQFDEVFVPDAQVLRLPGGTLDTWASLRTQLAQLIKVNLYVGLAQGAFEAARRYTSEQSRPYAGSGVGHATDDPYVQHRYGQLWLLLRPAVVLADLAALKLDDGLRQGRSISVQERGEIAVAVAEAKVLAHHASVEIGSQLFELTGARSTSSKLGLDRYWRNARVHTLHDPVDYKLRDLGRYALDGRLPEAGAHA